MADSRLSSRSVFGLSGLIRTDIEQRFLASSQIYVLATS